MQNMYPNFAGCACLLVRGVVSERRNFSSKSFKKSSFSSVCLHDWVACQFVQFSSGHGGQVPPFSSFSSFHEIFGPWPRLTWLAPFSPSSLQLFGKSRGAVLGPLHRKSQPTGPGLVARVEGWCGLLAMLAYFLSGMWRVVGVTQLRFKIV